MRRDQLVYMLLMLCVQMDKDVHGLQSVCFIPMTIFITNNKETCKLNRECYRCILSQTEQRKLVSIEHICTDTGVNS